MNDRLAILILALLLTAGGAVFAQSGEGQAMEMDMALFVPAEGLHSPSPPPLGLAERPGMQPLAVLDPAVVGAREELDRLILWNRLGRLPVQNGFSRPLPTAQRVAFGPELFGRGAMVGEHQGGLVERNAGGDVVWGTEMRVAQAWRLRLHLAEVELPAGAQLWVYGEDGETVGPFGLELRGPEGDLWTPSVGGEAIHLEVRLPAGAESSESPGFVLDKVLEMVDGGSGALGGMTIEPRVGECLVDAQCIAPATFDVIDLAQRGVAAVEFVDGGLSFVCTGGLLNSASQGLFFLTANHCFDNQASASSLEATWDYFTSSCGGPAPNMGTLPRSNGSTLLATGFSSDYTLVSLNSIPNNRVFLGWNANASAAGNNTVLNRISHPVHPETFQWLPQQYSRNHVDTSAQTCQGAPRPSFLYETFLPGMGDMGGTYGGSSGAPAIIAGGQVVGQLTGGCGLNPSDGCDYSNSEVDGAFSQSFSALGPILNTPSGGCVPDATTLCLRDGRFQVEVEWRNNQGVLRDANVVQGVQSTDSGLFYFLDPDNWEFLIKVLDGCSFNNPHYWVFFAATTNVEFTLTVTDTQAGMEKSYFNMAGHPANAVTDTRAFATCP